MLPIEQSCYWLATRPSVPVVALESHVETDVAIIGGGLTGLWTALSIKELSPATDVIVLEKNSVAYGASGRNAGMLSETIDHNHALAIEHFGESGAAQLARLGQDNVDQMIAFLARHAIECDYQPTGRLMVALTDRQLAECRNTVATARKLGVTTHAMLTSEEMRGELDSPLYLGGASVAGGGILNPVKLVEGLKRVALTNGIRVNERTGVDRIEMGRNASATIHAGAYRVNARRVVLATNAYSHHLEPRLLHRFIPLYDYILVSEPLTPAQHQSIGWQHRQGVTDGRTFFNYYRLTSDNRILWGTSEATYYRNNSVGAQNDHSAIHYQSLRESFRRHFPALRDLEFPFAWGGPIAATTRMTPFFGSFLNGRLLYGLGYTGHGLGSTHLAGKILARLSLERPDELTRLPLVQKHPLPYPPEPLRHLAVKMVTRDLRKVDAGADPSALLRLLRALGIGFSS
ncbi:MAG: FAD-dependent oxidoreductase [Gemmatimonadota bacterium]